MNLPKIFGLVKVRNEEAIIHNTLSFWGEFCTGGIFVYDDVSTDKTVEICRAHKSVVEVIQGDYWNPDRERAEWFNRQMILARAQQVAGPDDWFVYFDADEHPYAFTAYELFSNPDVKAIAMRLYDLYITPEDRDKHYSEREWIGPEFRTIVFFFRNSPYIKYDQPDQRQVTLEPGLQIPIHGDILHLSKGISIEEWDKTCQYYVRFWPKYANKWRERIGKAVHEDYLSDFGNNLIRWKDRDKGFSLEPLPYGKN